MTMSMVCDLCGRVGIRWMGPLSNLTHTECPHCGGRNCQRVDAADEEDEPEEEFGPEPTNGSEP
jgi:hypothetical protein